MPATLCCFRQEHQLTLSCLSSTSSSSAPSSSSSCSSSTSSSSPPPSSSSSSSPPVHSQACLLSLPSKCGDCRALRDLRCQCRYVAFFISFECVCMCVCVH